MAIATYLSVSPGESVFYLGANYFVKQILDLSSVLLEHPETFKVLRANISELQLSAELQEPKVNRDIADIPDKDWQEAERRFSIILPILQHRGNAEVVKEVSEIKHVSVPTLYRWVQMYESTGNKSSLAPAVNHGGKEKSRLPEDVESVIKSAIEEIYLNKQRKSMKKVCIEVVTRCKNANIKPPHPNTVRNRILFLSEEVKLQFRIGKKAAKEKYEPSKGSFPGADFPLSVVQIDHTKLDIIVVDKLHRKPIGRPWITLAIDVFSRTVIGYYISFDPPGSLSIGMCVYNAIMPKEMLLHKLDVTGEYPCYGLMKTIHCDNGKDFRGQTLLKACSEYNIQLNWRPVKLPHWGGHIERLLGTLLHELHTLPGTTFDKPHHRKYYNSEKEAALTIEELEQWIATYITNVYHLRIHKGIGQTPLAKWKEGILGSDHQIGIGLPKRIMDDRKLMLDFLPFEERTVQDYGVVIDYIYYYHDVLRKWVNAIEPNSVKAKTRRKFIFKRDPRDISVIYFFDPERKEYYPIPYRNISYPPISIWEFNEVIRKLKESNTQEIDEAKIFAAYQKLRMIEDTAISEKIIAKKNAAKAKRAHTVKSMQETSKTINKNHNEDVSFISDSLFDSKNIKPFEDLDHEAFN